MKMRYIGITASAYFLTDALNWQLLWGKDKYFLNSSHENLKNKVFFKTNGNSKEFVSSKDKQIN